MAKRARSYRFEMPYHVDAPILTDPAPASTGCGYALRTAATPPP